MPPQQRSKQKISVGGIIFLVLLIIIMIIVILIQVTIVTTFFLTNHRGRCVYKDENNLCSCRWTNSKTCSSLSGQYNSNLQCEDGFSLSCHQLE